MKKMLCVFLLIGIVESAKAEIIPSSTFACNYFITDWTCMGYETSYADFLSDYTAHVQTIPEGMATCVVNCDYPLFSTSYGFYKESGEVKFGDVSSFGLDYISSLPTELKLAVDEYDQLIEPQFYDAISLAMVTAAPDSVYVGTLGQFSLLDEGVVFAGNIIGNTDAIGMVGNRKSVSSAATAQYIYISTEPATTTGVLKELELKFYSVLPANLSLVYWYILDKSGNNFTISKKSSFMVKSNYIGIVTIPITYEHVTGIDEWGDEITEFVPPPITAGQYIGVQPMTAKLTQGTATTNPRRYRSTSTASPSEGVITTTLQNYAMNIAGNIYAPPLETIPGLSVVDSWTWEGEGHIKLQWHTGNICYKKGCYDYDFSLRFMQVGELGYGRPIYCQLGYRNTNIWLAGELRGGIKVYLNNNIISDHAGQNMEIPYQFNQRSGWN